VPIAAVSSQSYPGRKRVHNEDCILRLDHVPLYAVADGMGGEEAGELASAVAVARLGAWSADIAQHLRQATSAAGLQALRERVEQAYHDAHAAVLACAEQARRAGMGTTLVTVALLEDRALVWNVGDSRACLLRAGQLHTITQDHSLAMWRHLQGELSAEQLRNHPDRHRLYQAIGCGPSVDVDIHEVALADGDLLLICSDGLCGLVEDGQIAQLIDSASSLDEAAQALVEAANEAGGPDNISVVLVQWSGGPSADRLDHRSQALRKAFLFRDLSDPELATLRPYLHERRLARGQAVLREGEPGHDLIVLLEGRARVTRQGLPLTEIGPGGHLGELGLAVEGGRSATAVAMEDALVVSLAREDFLRLCRRRPALANRLCLCLLGSVGLRLRDLTERLEAVMRAASGAD
jgi:serine/threonine protein phosphatase PrpC